MLYKFARTRSAFTRFSMPQPVAGPPVLEVAGRGKIAVVAGCSPAACGSRGLRRCCRCRSSSDDLVQQLLHILPQPPQLRRRRPAPPADRRRPCSPRMGRKHGASSALCSMARSTSGLREHHAVRAAAPRSHGPAELLRCDVPVGLQDHDPVPGGTAPPPERWDSRSRTAPSFSSANRYSSIWIPSPYRTSDRSKDLLPRLIVHHPEIQLSVAGASRPPGPPCR